MASKVTFSLLKTVGKNFFVSGNRRLNPSLVRSTRSYSNFARFSEAPKNNLFMKALMFGVPTTLTFAYLNSQNTKSEEVKLKGTVRPESLNFDGRRWYQGYYDSKDGIIAAAYFPVGQKVSSFKEMIYLVNIKNQSPTELIKGMEDASDNLQIDEQIPASGEITFSTSGFAVNGDSVLYIISRAYPDRKNAKDLQIISYTTSLTPEEAEGQVENATIRTKWIKALKQINIE